MAERLCHHRPCRCEVASEQTWCGDVCSAAAREGRDDEACRCGHPECRPAHARDYDPDGPGPLAPKDVRNA